MRRGGWRSLPRDLGGGTPLTRLMRQWGLAGCSASGEGGFGAGGSLLGAMPKLKKGTWELLMRSGEVVGALKTLNPLNLSVVGPVSRESSGPPRMASR